MHVKEINMDVKKIHIKVKFYPVTPPKKRPYHHGDLRTALIEAALSLVEEHGVKGLALSDAAHRAGVSVAAPYRHFKDKEALLAEIAAEGFVLFRDALARAAQTNPKDKVQRLVEMGVAYVDFALEHRSHFKVMWESGIPKENYPEVGKAGQEAYLLLEKAAIDLLPGAPAGRQQALVAAAWSMVHGYASLTLESELRADVTGGDDKKRLRQTLHLFLDQFAS
jgi:AcrR family transcriptional regulator